MNECSIEADKIIRNIKLHILTDVELDSETLEMYNYLKDKFSDLKIYKSDKKENYAEIYYGLSYNNLILRYNTYYRNISIPLKLANEIEVMRNRWDILYASLNSLIQWYISEILNVYITSVELWPKLHIDSLKQTIKQIGHVQHYI